MYPDFQSDKIVSLHTCVLFTAVRLESGSIYWWGVLPFAQRKRLLEKYTNKKKSSSKQQKKKTWVGSPSLHWTQLYENKESFDNMSKDYLLFELSKLNQRQRVWECMTLVGSSLRFEKSAYMLIRCFKFWPLPLKANFWPISTPFNTWNRGSTASTPIKTLQPPLNFGCQHVWQSVTMNGGQNLAFFTNICQNKQSYQQRQIF